ncbi:hypothetical protein [Malonomonas rubra]|uniref:Ppx/GppA phosphatase family protein n=1 Tax=Malonomonas rubra TaxID=57040 RepID=UPI0026E9DD9B|nr:hypothetical protein [Malonomonas rubra]
MKDKRIAAIDVGSNTIRMLVGNCTGVNYFPELYRQQITRLAGGFQPGQGLASASMERTLAVFSEYAEILQQMGVDQVRAVGTAALRRAENAQHLINLIKLKTRLDLEIINGEEEARLSSAGVLSALQPIPDSSMIVDIGGGSTEVIFCHQQKVLFSCSYPLGVVQLCEEMPDEEHRLEYLKAMVVKFASDLLRAKVSAELLETCQLVGTAGTVTSLAALDLEMREYDRNRINNHRLEFEWLENVLDTLSGISVAEREQLPGFEPGRGDVIIPGLQLLIALGRYFKQSSILVADSGLLEGILLDFCQN